MKVNIMGKVTGSLGHDIRSTFVVYTCEHWSQTIHTEILEKFGKTRLYISKRQKNNIKTGFSENTDCRCLHIFGDVTE
jgi:hypothetical protein